MDMRVSSSELTDLLPGTTAGQREVLGVTYIENELLPSLPPYCLNCVDRRAFHAHRVYYCTVPRSSRKMVGRCNEAVCMMRVLLQVPVQILACCESCYDDLDFNESGSQFCKFVMKFYFRALILPT